MRRCGVDLVGARAVEELFLSHRQVIEPSLVSGLGAAEGTVANAAAACLTYDVEDHTK
jgi:hypothetical protein